MADSGMTKKQAEALVGRRLDSLGEMWTRMVDASRVMELLAIRTICAESGVKAPRRLLLSLALCLSGEFRYAPRIREKRARNGR